MFLTIKLCNYAKLNCFSIEQIIYIKIDLTLNNLQRLICHKPNKPNQTNQVQQPASCANEKYSTLATKRHTTGPLLVKAEILCCYKIY